MKAYGSAAAFPPVNGAASAPTLRGSNRHASLGAAETNECTVLELARIESEFTSITVMPDAVAFGAAAHANTGESGRAATGARVTVEFVRTDPLVPGAAVRIRYDIAENGRWREFAGVPKLTHTTRSSSGMLSYHYRISHWIPADQIDSQLRPGRLPGEILPAAVLAQA